MTVDHFAGEEFWRWPGWALAEAIRAKDVKAREVAESCLARAHETNPHVNALVHIDDSEAREQAARVDTAPDRAGALNGVPISIKDNVPQAGHPNSGGVAAAHAIAEEDAPSVALLRHSGAVFIGRSNVPAFSMRWFTENDVHGRTNNPWSTKHTPGGSSGGAAAAVASGMVPIAHGNDIGGSVRYPAASCGVMGLRPTTGRIPHWSGPSRDLSGMAGLSPSMALMAVEGPLARTVRDLRLALEVMAVPDLRDPSCTTAPYRNEAPLPSGTRIGIVRSIPGIDTHPTNHAALDRAARWLEEAGYEIVDFDCSELEEAHYLWFLILLEDFRASLPLVDQLGDDQVKASLENMYETAAEHWGRHPTLAEYVNGHERRTALIALLQQKMTSVPLVLTPASAQTTFEHGTDHGPLDGASALAHAQWPMTSVPVLGMPAVTVPTGVVDGLPTSVQILGGRFTESWILDAAQALEDRAGSITPIDPNHFP